MGHRAGVESVRDVVEACVQLGVANLTLYTFSVENWRRPTNEVHALMLLLRSAIRQELAMLQDNDIRLCAIGDVPRLPEGTRRTLEGAMHATASNRRMRLVLALSYSGRQDIVQAARALCTRVQRGLLDPASISEDTVSGALCTAGIPDPDLLVRTGGENRISNFLLWQLAYTEMVITDCYWPAFRREHLYDAICTYQDRERRFGRVTGQ